MLDVRRLRVLSEVAARGSFSAAADALSLTQSAVSQHVAALEREVGLALVERGTRPVELTEAGHALTRHATGIFARLDDAEQELGEIAGRRRGRLRFGSFPTALVTLAPPAFARFRRRHPEVTLTVVDDHLQRLLPRLGRGELDLALIYRHEALSTATATSTATVLLEDEFRVVLPARHRLTRRTRPLELAQLASEPWIGGAPDSAWYRIASHHCRAAGFVPARRVRVRRLRRRAGARRRRARRLGDPRAGGRPSACPGSRCARWPRTRPSARSAPPGPATATAVRR